MAKCDLKIKLAHDKRDYKLGDTLTGYVEVMVDAECDCKEISLTKYWQTHGKGNIDRGNKENIILHKGPLNPGVYRYDFQFELNESPLSYHGSKINIDWYLKAQADIPWAIDPKAELDFLLRANPESKKVDAASADEKKHHLFSKSATNAIPLTGKGHYSTLIIWGILLLISLGVTFTGILKSIIPLAAFFGLVSFMLIRTIISTIMRTIAENTLGDITCNLSKHDLLAGEHIDLTLGLKPPKGAQINRAVATLIRTERAVSGSGTRRSTHTKAFAVSNVVIAENITLSAGGHFNRSARLTLPADAMHSFRASDNQIYWRLQVNIDIANCPDWSTSLNVNVLP